MSANRTVQLHKFDRWLRASEVYEEPWRKDNEENFSYYDNDQWTEEETDVLDERGQSPTTLNVVRPTVDMVLALEQSKRTDLQIIGREESDEAMARLLTELVKQIHDTSDIDYYLSRVFREGIIGGRSWVHTYPRKENGQVCIKVDWVPWEEVFIDPFHRRPDGSDARWQTRRVWMDRDYVKKKWPGKADAVDSAFLDDYEGIEYEAKVSTTDRGIGYYDKKNDRIAVHFCWYRDADKKLKHVVFADEVFFVGSPEGENPDPYGIDTFPFTPFTCFRTRKGRPRGMVRLLRSVQDQINKLNSKYLWNMSSNRIMYETGAVTDPDDLREEWNRPDGAVALADGGMGRIRTEENLRESSYLSNHLQFLLAMVQRISGVNDSMLGYGGQNERSAMQQENRILQGAAMQTQILENLHFTKKQVTRSILRLIGKYYTDRHVIRIVRPNGEWQHYAINNPTGETDEGGKPILENKIDDILKYDVVFKSVPPFNTTRERSAQIISEVAKTGMLPPQLIGKALFELLDIPHKEELIFQLEQAQQAAAEPPPAQ